MKLHAAMLLSAVTLTAVDVPPLGLDRYIPAPEDNPITDQQIALGRKLFNDKRLSRDQSLSCATCHKPERAFADENPLAIGVSGRKGNRRTPTIINRAWGRSFFWDGRTTTLEEQVLQPILNPLEMDLKLEEIRTRTGMEPQQVAKALATYVRSVLAGDSPYDRYIAGDREAMSAEARRGLKLFRGKANCATCHIGPNLTDEQFHNTGIGWNGAAFTDTGRSGGAFKTPTLRELDRRPPYMHDGSLATIEEVIRFYDEGGRDNPALDPEIRPINLTEAEKRDLLAFLRSLNGTIRQ